MDESQIYDNFLNVLIQFSNAAVVAWPDDPLLKVALEVVKKLDGAVALDLFEKHFGPQVNELSKKNVETLYLVGKHEELQALNIQEKYESSNEATREVVWTYIGNLCKIISMKRLYKHIPGGILSAVTDAAQKLKTKLETGEMDASNVNPYEIGKEVMEKFNPSELENMMKSFMKNEEAMETVMAQMSSMMNGSQGSKLAEQMTQAFESAGLPAGTPDLSSMLSDLSNGTTKKPSNDLD